MCEYETRGFVCTSHGDCKHGACNLQTGHCVCSAGHFGRDCGLSKTAGKPCTAAACQNGGVCSVESKRCKCPASWSGDYCDIPTNGFQCQSSADCNYHAGMCDPSTHNCLCNQGYFGVACEASELDGLKCTTSSCQNGGICSTFERCICPREWGGDFCEYPSLGYQCQTNNDGCSGHGVCDISTRHCRCNEGYYGIRCEISATAGQKCMKNCKNGGTCSIATKHCICPPGWTGNFCEIDSTGWKCTNSKCDCSNNGYCNLSTGNCICDTGYSGHNCTSVY